MVQMESFEVFILVEAIIILHQTLYNNDLSQVLSADHVAYKDRMRRPCFEVGTTY